MTRPGTSGAAPGPAGPGDPGPDPADVQEVPGPDDWDDESAPDDGGIVTAGDRHPRDEHPLASFASDPRMPIWIRRAVLAAAAGLVVGILVDWRVGLTAAAVAA